MDAISNSHTFVILLMDLSQRDIVQGINLNKDTHFTAWITDIFIITIPKGQLFSSFDVRRRP